MSVSMHKRERVFPLPLDERSARRCVTRCGGRLLIGVPLDLSGGRVAYNAHRVYGPRRFAHLVANWKLRWAAPLLVNRLPRVESATKDRRTKCICGGGAGGRWGLGQPLTKTVAIQPSARISVPSHVATSTPSNFQKDLAW